MVMFVAAGGFKSMRIMLVEVFNRFEVSQGLTAITIGLVYGCIAIFSQ